MIVLDASAMIEVLLGTSTGRRVLRRLRETAPGAHAPELIDIEVTQVLRRYVSTKDLTPERGRLAFELFTVFPLRRHRHRPLLTRVWELRANTSAYDATYLALAETLQIPLLTCDQKLASVPRHGARVEVIAAGP